MQATRSKCMTKSVSDTILEQKKLDSTFCVLKFCTEKYHYCSDRVLKFEIAKVERFVC